VNEDEAEAWRAHQQNSKKRTYYEWKESEHPGCQLSGHLLLDRTPGTYYHTFGSNNCFNCSKSIGLVDYLSTFLASFLFVACGGIP
jgi:hypothetical protein